MDATEESILSNIEASLTNNPELVNVSNGYLYSITEDSGIISTLGHIISTTPNTLVKYKAIIILKNAILRNINSDYSSLLSDLFVLLSAEEQPKIINSFIDLCVVLQKTPSCTEIQTAILEYIDENGFSNNLIEALSSLPYLNTEAMEDFRTIIACSMKSENQFPAIKLAFRLTGLTDDESLSSMFETCVQYVISNIQGPLIGEATELLTNAIDSHLWIVNQIQIIESFLPFLLDESTPIFLCLYLKNPLFSAVTSAKLHGIEISEEIQSELLNACIILSRRSYQESWCEDIDSIDYFEEVCTSFSDNPSFVETALEYFPQGLLNKETIASSVLSLTYCLHLGKEIIFHFIDELIPNLCEIATSLELSMIIRSAAVKCLETFAEEYQESIDEYAVQIIRSLLQSYHEGKNIRSMVALSTVIKNLTMDEECSELCLGSIIECMDTSLLDSTNAFPSLIELVKATKLLNDEMYQRIFTVVSSIKENENDSLIPQVIDCFCMLAKRNPNLFSSYLPDFCTFVIENINNIDYYIANSAIRAVGKIVPIFREELMNQSETIVEELIKKAQVDIQNSFDSNLSCLALSILCSILNKWTHLFEANIDFIISSFESKLELFDESSSLSLARTAVMFAGFCSICDGALKPSLSICNSILDSTSDPLSMSEALAIPITLISKGVDCVEPCFEILSKFYNNELNDNYGIRKYDEDLFNNAAVLTKEIISKLEEASFELMTPFVEELTELLSSVNLDIKEFSIQVLGQLFEIPAPEEYNEVIQLLLEASVDILHRRSSVAAFAIQQVAEGNISSICIEVVSALKGALFLEEATVFADNVAGALAAIGIRSTLDDISDVIPELLRRSPATADFSENDILRDFVETILEKNYNYECAQVLARFS